MSEAEIWCNGEWRRADEPVAGILDRGLANGLGLFETMLAVDGVPLAITRHLRRLAESAPWCGVAVPDAEVLRAACLELLERNDLTRGRVRLRITVTAGTGALDVLEPGAGAVTVVAAALAPERAASATAVLCPWTRNERDPLAGHKTLSYASNLAVLAWAKRCGHDEAVLSNSRGELCECATSNLFWVSGGTLLTPGLLTGCLPGVTRALVLERARAAGIPLEEVEVAAACLTDASEAFLTSSLRGVQPLRKLGARELPAPGPITARLAGLLDDCWRHHPDP